MRMDELGEHVDRKDGRCCGRRVYTAVLWYAFGVGCDVLGQRDFFEYLDKMLSIGFERFHIALF